MSGFNEAVKRVGEDYHHPRTIDGYIQRYQIQVDFGYDKNGYCQGLINLLNELKMHRERAYRESRRNSEIY